MPVLQTVKELADEVVEQVADRWSVAVTGLSPVPVVVSCRRIFSRRRQVVLSTSPKGRNLAGHERANGDARVQPWGGAWLSALA